MIAARIVVFAKAPQPGFAKTRLIPALGVMEATALAQEMLMHTLHQALAANIGTVELCVTPQIQDKVWQPITLPGGITISDQGEGDLGVRLSRAAARTVANAESVILIGTDCVEMSSKLLRTAAQTLDGHDAVIHATADGGYALLGCTQYSPLLFNDIPWSTDAVAQMTIDRIKQLGWSLHAGEVLRDIDEPQDLEFLPKKWKVYAEV